MVFHTPPAQAPKSNTPRSLGSPATATTRPPRGGPIQRHLRASSFAPAPDSCAMEASFVLVLSRRQSHPGVSRLALVPADGDRIQLRKKARRRGPGARNAPDRCRHNYSGDHQPNQQFESAVAIVRSDAEPLLDPIHLVPLLCTARLRTTLRLGIHEDYRRHLVLTVRSEQHLVVGDIPGLDAGHATPRRVAEI